MRIYLMLLAVFCLSGCSSLFGIENKTAKFSSKVEESPETLFATTSQEWVLPVSKSLKSELKLWANSAGWKLDWRCSDDFPVKFSAKFKGVLVGKSSVIQNILLAVNERTGRPLNVSFKRGNKVIVIDDGGFWIKG